MDFIQLGGDANAEGGQCVCLSMYAYMHVCIRVISRIAKRVSRLD